MPPSLPAGELTLRCYRPDHGPFIAEAVRESGRHLSRYETWAHPTRGDRYLGSAGLSEISLEHRTAGLGYWVRTSETGHGVATAAALAVVEAGFEELGLQRIELMAAVDNTASRRVADKVGAELEGILRKRQVLAGIAVDCALYSVVR